MSMSAILSPTRSFKALTPTLARPVEITSDDKNRDAKPSLSMEHISSEEFTPNEKWEQFFKKLLCCNKDLLSRKAATYPAERVVLIQRDYGEAPRSDRGEGLRDNMCESIDGHQQLVITLRGVLFTKPLEVSRIKDSSSPNLSTGMTEVTVSPSFRVGST